jgi:uncharacterized BrkB/YihY/UPF0761 family membrane protein
LPASNSQGLTQLWLISSWLFRRWLFKCWLFSRCLYFFFFFIFLIAVVLMVLLGIAGMAGEFKFLEPMAKNLDQDLFRSGSGMLELHTKV